MLNISVNFVEKISTKERCNSEITCHILPRKACLFGVQQKHFNFLGKVCLEMSRWLEESGNSGIHLVLSLIPWWIEKTYYFLIFIRNLIFLLASKVNENDDDSTIKKAKIMTWVATWLYSFRIYYRRYKGLRRKWHESSISVLTSVNAFARSYIIM